MTSAFISESPIFQEAEIIKTEPKKAIFRMILQTVDEVNQNKRMYPRAVLTESLKDCNDRMSRRAFTGELDHPLPQGNQQFDSMRQTMVSLEQISHIIRDYEFKGNNLIGEIETASTPKGGVLFGLIKDKVGVGMSMRGMAELFRVKDYNVVKSPLMIVSFDSVSLPSHKAAVIDFNECRLESMEMLFESPNNEMICTSDGKCYLASYFDKLIETKMITFFDRWI